MIRCRNPQNVKGMDQDILYGCNEAQSGLRGFAVYAQDPAFSVEMMEKGSQFIGIFGNALGCSFRCGAGHELW